MPRFGRFETTRELHRGGLAVVYLARDIEAGAESAEAFAVKELQVSHGLLAAEQAERLVAAFLQRAKVQQAAAGGTHWAPVHEAGRSENGAYYVTDLYPRSARRLVVGRVKLDHAALRMFAESVLHGLKELEGAAGRGHGNLKLTNVLVAGGGDRPLDRVVLADPGGEGGELAVVRAKDLRALGEAIHELVLHQPLRARSGWPVPASGAWTRLGRSGDRWRAFCNRLLDPSLVESPPALDDILAEITELGEQSGSRRRLLFVAAASVAALAVVGAGVLYLMPGRIELEVEEVVGPDVFDEQRWVRLCREYQGWFGVLVLDLDPATAQAAERQRLFSSVPFLAQVPELLGTDPSRLHPWKIGGSRMLLRDLAVQPPEGARMPTAVRRTREALAVMDKVEALFSPDGLSEWPLWSDARRLEDACRERGWASAVEHLQTLHEGVRPSPDLMRAVKQLHEASEFIAALDRLDQTVAKAEETDDRVLQTLSETLGDAMHRSAASRRGEEFQSVVRGLDEQLAGPIRTVVESEWELLDLDLFGQSAAHATFDKDPRPRRELLSIWLEEARNPQYRQLTTADPRELESWAQVQAQAHAGIRRLTDEFRLVPAQGPEGLETRVAEIEAEIADLKRLPWNTPNEAEVTQRSQRVREDLSRLREDIDNAVRIQVARAAQSLDDVRREIAAMENISDSAAINSGWRTGRDVVLNAEGTAIELDDRAGALREALLALDAQVAPPEGELAAPAGPVREWRTGVVKAGAVQRERVLQSILSDVDWSQWAQWQPEMPRPVFEPSDAMLSEYRDWLDGAQQIMYDLAQVEARLDELYPIAARTDGDDASARELLDRWSTNDVFLDEGIQVALTQVLARVGELERLEASTDRSELREAAGADGNRARAMAAWRRLGEPDLLMDLEAGSRQQALDDEARLLLRMRGIAGTVPEERRAAIREELNREGRLRWALHVEAMSSTDEISAAVNFQETLGGDVSDLSTRARFNLGMFELQVARQDEGLEEEELKVRIEAFRAMVLQTPELAELESVGVLLAELGELISEQEEEPPIDVTTLGPGDPRIGWRGEASPDGQRVVFSSPDSGQTITFVLVEPASETDAPAFISTEEVSLGLLLGVVTEAAAWDQLTPLMTRWDSSIEPDPRRGPRVWIWQAVAGRPINVTASWLAGNQDLRPLGRIDPYPGGGTGFPPPRPANEHPMQYISAEAALFVARLIGCRFPSTVEWETALAVELEGGTLLEYLEQWLPNLRDEVWHEQRQHMNALRQAGTVGATNVVLPSEGGFWREQPESYWEGHNDGALWLLPVSEGQGRVFQHLIGNVAEFVHNDPAALEEIPAGAPAEATAPIRTALRSAGQLGVIGGSAQSPPQIGPMQRQTLAGSGGSGIGYSDVGMRLAFSAAGAGTIETVAVRLGRILSPESGPLYLPPPMARGP